jgi:hypothetical protein
MMLRINPLETERKYNEITQNDVVAVGGGGAQRGEGVGARSSTSAVTAGDAADTGSGGGEGAEWQMMTRGKARAGGGGVRKTTMRVRPSVSERGEASLQATPSFEAAATAARKREVEDSVNDQLIAIAAAIEQLTTIQKEMAENQKAFLESNKAILDRNKDLTEMIKTRARRSRLSAH